MNIENIAPFINLSIRGLTLIGKFILLFFLAKFLSPLEVGVYGLLIVVISYSIYLVGFDFYVYSHREIIRKERRQWWKYLKNQVSFTLVAYILILPFILLVMSIWIDKKWLYYLGVLIVLEHLTQEFFRLLIADNKNVLANNLHFIKNGLWCYIIVFMMFFSLLEKNLDNILLAWILFDIIALVYGFLIFKQSINFDNKSPINYKWIKDGLKVCLPLLLATLLLRSVSTIDRIWLSSIDGLEVLAAYALFFSMSNVMINFLETSVFSFFYPKLIKDRNNLPVYKSMIKQMLIQTIILITFISICLVGFLPYALAWFGKDIYIDYQYLFFIVLFANIFLCLGIVAQYILYSSNKDKHILQANFFGLIVFIITTQLLYILDVSVAVAYGLLIAYLFILLLKFYLAIPLMNQKVEV